MIKDWKMIAISATLAFILSFIFGFIGRVSLGVLILRALSGAVIFGALALGVSILFRRFLPELYELQSESSAEIEDDLSEHKDKQNVAVNSDGLSIPKPQIDISIDDGDENYELEINPESGSSSADSLDTGNDLVDEISESEDTVSSIENDQVPVNIDALPDMGVFSNSFEGVPDDDSNEVENGGAATLDILGEEQDPELVVRAVRTMVKKDQEG